jgi:hypothetical protein
VIFIGIRTEASRHFMEIIVLGFGTCRIGPPPMLGEPEAMICKLAILLWAKYDEVNICSSVPRIYQGTKG